MEKFVTREEVMKKVNEGDHAMEEADKLAIQRRAQAWGVLEDIKRRNVKQ